MFKTKYSLFVAGSYTLNQVKNVINDFATTNQTDYRTQLRIEGKRFFTGRLNLLVGTEYQQYGSKRESFRPQEFDETLIAGYSELEWTPINRFAMKPGIRYEHSVLLNQSKIAPRFSMAYKTGVYTQASFATGVFYQNAVPMYLMAGLRPDMEEAVHVIANWQYTKNDRTFRVEGYHKNYNQLVRELPTAYSINRNRFIDSAVTRVNNSGYGYADGLEIFYRDKKTIKNTDCRISYSYIDTRRLYQNYVASATPTFIANHNLNLVASHFITKWSANISATYSYASGFPYYNPEKASDNNAFLSDKTRAFQNFALSAAYLHTFGKWFTVFYIQVDNVLNTRNVFGYRYRFDGNYQVIPGSRTEINPALYRTIFFGFNCSLTKFSRDEL